MSTPMAPSDSTRHGHITPANHGPYVVVASYVMMCMMLLLVMTRLITKYLTIRTLRLDDLSIIAAAVFAIIQSILVQQAVDNGLGRHRDALTDSEFDSYSKYNYASQILVILSLCFAKISLSWLVTSVTPSTVILWSTRAVLATITLWTMTSIIALGLQCKVPTPWDFTPGRCINQDALYNAIGAINILTDVAIVAISIAMMWNVHVSSTKRVNICLTFIIRFVVCAAVIAQLIYLRPYINSTDQTWENVNPSICQQFVMHLSIITACIPLLKRFVSDLQTGQFKTVIPSDNENNSSSGRSYPRGTYLNFGDGRTPEAKKSSKRESRRQQAPLSPSMVLHRTDSQAELSKNGDSPLKGILQTTDIRVESGNDGHSKNSDRSY